MRKDSLILMIHRAANTGDLVAYVCSATPLNGIVPTEIQVIPYGKHKTLKYPMPFLHDETSQSLVQEDFSDRLQGTDMVIDYEHQSLSEPPVEAPAAGWIKKLINRGKEGTWAIVEWTNKAKAYIENKEYKYVSPVFFCRKADGRVTMLINLALTNNPNITGMVPLINKATTAKKEEANMERIAAMLGLPKTATEEEIIVALNKMKLTMDGAIALNKAIGVAIGVAEGAPESEITGTIMAMKASHSQQGTLAQEVAMLKNRLQVRDEADIEVLVNTALAGDGKGAKLLPAQKEWALDYAKKNLEGFKVFLNKAPYAVITGKIAGEEKGGGGGEQLDEVTLQVCKMMGNKPEDVLKNRAA